jgi:hypothetical protein
MSKIIDSTVNDIANNFDDDDLLCLDLDESQSIKTRESQNNLIEEEEQAIKATIDMNNLNSNKNKINDLEVINQIFNMNDENDEDEFIKSQCFLSSTQQDKSVILTNKAPLANKANDQDIFVIINFFFRFILFRIIIIFTILQGCTIASSFAKRKFN